MSYDWAKPGVQCVCINDDWEHISVDGYSVPIRVPMLNEVLTIAGVRLVGDRLFLWFDEITKRQCDGPLFGDIAYNVICFRPLLKRPTDIGVFKQMLLPAPGKTVPA